MTDLFLKWKGGIWGVQSYVCIFMIDVCSVGFVKWIAKKKA